MVNSVCIGHFPQFRFREQNKKLWNPVLKRTFSDLPEERVRLSLVDYLLHDAGCSPNRISFESPVKLSGDKHSSRTDLICYDSQYKPHLLVECKAPSVPLTESVLHQIARYNAGIDAPFLLITNGKKDLFADLRQEKPIILNQPPEPYRKIHQTEREYSYWSDRAFMGSSSPEPLKEEILYLLRNLYTDTNRFYPYLDLKERLEFDWPSGYYHIAGDNEQALALSVHSSPQQKSMFTAILNTNGQNVAFIRIALDTLYESETPDSEYFLPDFSEKITIREHFEFDLTAPLTDIITGLSEFLRRAVADTKR